MVTHLAGGCTDSGRYPRKWFTFRPNTQLFQYCNHQSRGKGQVQGLAPSRVQKDEPEPQGAGLHQGAGLLLLQFKVGLKTAPMQPHPYPQGPQAAVATPAGCSAGPDAAERPWDRLT